MRILGGKARNRACRRTFYPLSFSSYRQARNKPATGLVNKVDLYRLRHELRTPLTGMLGLSELLSAQDLPGHAPFWLATMQACGQQLASLIDRSLLPDSRPGGVDCRGATRINGGGFLEQLIGSHWPAARAGDTRLYLLLQPQARKWWRVDPVLLRQGLDNLLANAIRFSPGGYVLLEAAVLPSGVSDSETLQLAVENYGSGHGQPAHGESKVPLQIADGNFTGSTGGGFDYADRSYRMFSRGQGLRVVEQISNALHGQLQRSFTASGGVRFELQLPAVISRREKLVDPFGPILFRKLHCLLLLEEPMGRIVSTLLKGLGLPLEQIKRLDQGAFQALAEKQFLICKPSRMPPDLLCSEEEIHPHSICLVAKSNHADKPGCYVQILPEPLFQAGLQAALLRCLVLQGMASPGSGAA